MSDIQNNIYYLFDPKLLDDINTCNFVGKITLENLGSHLKVRPLCLSDYEKGYLKLLSELTKVGDISYEQFQARFNSMKSCSNTYYIVVIEDTSTGLIIGSATLVIEQKFIHNTSSRGRIEDVVIKNDYRGQQLGKLLVDILIERSQKLGCYKISLECKMELIPFYNKFGLKQEESYI
ncbi:glucosamine 6-phosphate N-acetyltransferase-like isoform X1 [Octopus vulgaris]|uniref:Glucosamine 6-phosphate N-acetyltransferase n=1 Tax=Octopus vulgaris TaxID=6645 RepID=A0AA36F9W9_OCTVU|nr:glucosamine 6-phosphate N-acetyltransferase-like isoform X1 [Octopus vulgaris]